MAHFIQLFFEQLGAEFPFVTYDDVSRDFWDQMLSPLMANCIAAMATRYAPRIVYHASTKAQVRYSTLSELTVRGLHNVAETYGDNAKVNNPFVQARMAVDLWTLLDHISFHRAHSLNGHFAWSNAVVVVRIQE